MMLVDLISADWGMAPAGPGSKEVWFRLQIDRMHVVHLRGAAGAEPRRGRSVGQSINRSPLGS